MFIRSKSFQKQPTRRWQPDFIAPSVTTINFQYLRQLGITTCFVDLDGTVVDSGAFEVDVTLARALQQSGMRVMIATNRPRHRDLLNLQADLHAAAVIHPVFLGSKPTKRYYQQALRTHGLQPTEVVMIGDHFLQDVVGANRAGIYSLLVFKLGTSKDRLDGLVSIAERRLAHRLVKRYHQIN
jgi:HAD superfamily phosphatase (TIGR01668 family)